MGIVYILSQIIIFVSFILVKKTEKKLNILGFIAISIGTLFCYNTFVCYVLTFFTIPVTLPNLSIINIVISIIFIAIMLRKNKIQSYMLKKIDFLYISLLLIAILIVSFINFGFPFNIKYETGDPSVHYLTSEMFAENNSLLITDKDEVYSNLSTRKTVSYVNSGLIMKCFDGVIDSFYNYNIFIAFGIFVLFLTAVSMFTTIQSFSINKKTRFLAFVVSLIYTMGYPLNSFLFGFEYLSMGILLLCLIFDMVHYFKEYSLKLIYIIIIFALLNFGLFSAYYMFVPFLYSALWIYFCIHSYEKDKSIFTKKNIVLLLITLLIPFFLGFIYHIVPEIYGVIINSNIDSKTINIDSETMFNYSSNLVKSGLSVYGYIYVNLYSNMLLLLPLAIYIIIKKWKENRFAGLNMIFCIGFIEILLLGFLLDKVSIYYLTKNYFALWFILFYLNYKGLVELYKKHPKVSFGLVGFYILLIVINLLFVDTELENRELNPNERPTTVVEVFGANKTILKYKKTDYYKEELEILKYLNDNISYNNKVEILGDMEQGYWAYTLTRYLNNKENLYTAKGQNGLTIKMLKTTEDIETADYIVYFNRTERYQRLKTRVHALGKIIFENEFGGIVKCNY